MYCIVSGGKSINKLLCSILHCILYQKPSRTVTGGVEYLEKRGDYGGAVELLELLLSQSQFGRSLRGHWLERLSLNLDFHLGEKQKVCLNKPNSLKGSI